MAELLFIAQPTSEVALAAGITKTVLQIAAPANQRVKIKGWGIFFDGQTVTAAPVIVQIMRQLSAGTMTALTPLKRQVAAETVQTTAAHTATLEPTNSDIIDVLEIHPQSGYEVQFPDGQEIIVPGGGYLAIVVNAPEAVNCLPKFICEE
jgi:hypothetical protein